MLRVTGTTLEFVRRILGAEGSAAQITELPDGVLSQVADVSRWVPGYGSSDGWVWFRNQVPLDTTTRTFGFVTRDQILATVAPSPSAPPEEIDVWLMHAALTFDPFAATSDLDVSIISVAFPNFAGAGGGVFRASVAYLEAVAGDAIPMSNDFDDTQGNAPPFASTDKPARPIRIPVGGRIEHAAELAVVGGGLLDFSFSNANLLFFVGPRGMRPPGVA